MILSKMDILFRKVTYVLSLNKIEAIKYNSFRNGKEKKDGIKKQRKNKYLTEYDDKTGDRSGYCLYRR